MAETFANLEVLSSVRAKINAMAAELNALSLLVDAGAVAVRAPDTDFLLYDEGDESRTMQFVLDAVDSGTDLLFEVPLASGRLALDTQFDGTNAGLVPTSDGSTAKFLRGDGAFSQVDYDDLLNQPNLTLRGRPFLLPEVGDELLTCTVGGSVTGTNASVADRVVLFQFMAPRDFSISAMKLGITSNTGTGNMKLGVFEADANGRPGLFMGETGDISTAASGYLSGSISLTFEAGKSYWMMARFSSVVTYRVWDTGAVPQINAGAYAAQTKNVLYDSLAFATPMASWVYASSQVDNGGAPAITLVIA